MSKVLHILRDFSSGNVPLIGSEGDRGCVACGIVHQGEIERHPAVEGDEDLLIDARGRYWCLDCVVQALSNVRRRVDDRNEYDYPWRFEDTGGLNGQHARTLAVTRASEQRVPEFSYVRLPGGKSTVTCTCGWKDPLGPVAPSPFDPAEALAAAYAEHPCCKVTP